MQAEALRARALELAEAFRKLRARKAVLGLARVTHDGVAQHELAAGVEAAADDFRNAAVFREKRNMRDVVKVDQNLHLARKAELFRGRIVGGKHDVRSSNADRAGKQQFRHGRAVHSAADAVQELHNRGVWQRLDREIFAKTVVPGERFLQAEHILANAGFVVDMKRRGVFQHDGFQFLFAKRQCSHALSSFKRRSISRPASRSAIEWRLS
ncbi:hypothetical protein SDC9_76467 [bioreactor metagenome]|uniref:Uncharacterized protein n=1 Tax=bioreactor metagenome TaxID=1076179 RepID=A0A644YMW7_9ZZZZ